MRQPNHPFRVFLAMLAVYAAFQFVGLVYIGFIRL